MQSDPFPPNQYDSFAEKYIDGLDKKPHNAFYERPAMLSLLPEVKGKTILDAGCGNGWYAQHHLEGGADVTVVDASEKMLENVQQRCKGKLKTVLWDLQTPLTWAESSNYDIVYSSLTLHYLFDWSTPIQEFYRVLRPNGRLLFSVHHPFADWRIFRIENYFETSHIQDDWGFPVHFYRRPLQEIISPLITAGFVIDKLLEPKPTEDFLKADPDGFKKLSTSPLFLIIRCHK